MGHVWLEEDDNSRKAQIAARAYPLRIGSAATAPGLWVASQGQVLQEFRETAEPVRRVHEGPASERGPVPAVPRMGCGPSAVTIARRRRDGRIMNA
jgi:hypothetical protein